MTILMNEGVIACSDLPDALLVERTELEDGERLELSTWPAPLEPIQVCTCNPVFAWFRRLFW